MRKLLLVLIISILALNIFGCNKDTKEKDLFNTYTWKDGIIKINGDTIKFKDTKIKDLDSDKFGEFTAIYGLNDNMVYGNSYANGNFKNLDKYYLDFQLKNENELSIGVEECTIYGLIYSRYSTEDDLDIEILLPGGFNVATCKLDDIISAWGEPVATEGNRYEWGKVGDDYISLIVNPSNFIMGFEYYIVYK